MMNRTMIHDRNMLSCWIDYFYPVVHRGPFLNWPRPYSVLKTTRQISRGYISHPEVTCCYFMASTKIYEALFSARRLSHIKTAWVTLQWRLKMKSVLPKLIKAKQATNVTWPLHRSRRNCFVFPLSMPYRVPQSMLIYAIYYICCCKWCKLTIILLF